MSLKDRLKKNIQAAESHATELSKEDLVISRDAPKKRWGNRAPELGTILKPGTCGGLTPEKIMPDRKKAGFVKQTTYYLPALMFVIENMFNIPPGRMNVFLNAITMRALIKEKEEYARTGHFISAPQALVEFQTAFSEVLPEDTIPQMLENGWLIDGLDTSEDYETFKREIDAKAFDELTAKLKNV